MNAPFAATLLGWKSLRRGGLAPNTADSDNSPSILIAGAVLDMLGVPRGEISGVVNPQSGRPLELSVAGALADELALLAPGRGWMIDGTQRPITAFAQYDHLQKVDALVKRSPELRTSLGTDYLIKPDVVVGLPGRAGGKPFLHAAVSCKWTIRSDRVQNIRHENTQMIRHRRGRLPHLVTVTAEPLPTRLASIARGTGEVDAVYHIAYEALDSALRALGRTAVVSNEQLEAWGEVTGQGRVRPFSDLARTLANW